MIVETTSNLTLTDFLKKLLKARFPGNKYKIQLDDSHPSKLRMACPYCGDSKDKDNKKRGNLYLATSTYKCFNDGCMKRTTLKDFIGTWAIKYSLEIPFVVLDAKDYVPSKTANHFTEFLKDDSLNDSLIKISDLVHRFSLVRADKLLPTSKVRKYLENERLIQYVKGYEEYIYGDASDTKVYLFNVDRSTGNTIGFAIRYLDGRDIKYILKNYTDIMAIYKKINLSEEELNTVNFMNNYFNLLNIDLDKIVYVAEGQFDSLFVNNCFSTTGVSKSKDILLNFDKSKLRILFDADRAGSRAMTEFIRDGYYVFLWKKLLFDLKRRFGDDSSLKKLKKMKDINDLFVFLHTRSPKMTITQFNLLINKYFSNSQFDILYI